MTTSQLSELIFPQASRSITQFLSDHKRSALTCRARLSSIKRDAGFVQKVHEAHNLPLIANERCGSWYLDPSNKTQSAYFKSTDGHAGQWTLSLRRLNLQVLATIAESQGCIIVDSTRRGKSMPDALSKTIPIWIAVWNRLLFPGDSDACRLQTPRGVVPASEHSQIEARLDEFANGLKALNLEINALRSAFQKPMSPVWVTHTAGLNNGIDPVPSKYYPVVLCTASSHLSSEVALETSYVQGAADDSESWAHGLTPELYWRHQKRLLECSEDQLPDLITSLLRDDAAAVVSTADCKLIKPTDNLYIGTHAAVEGRSHQKSDLHIRIAEHSAADEYDSSDTKHILRLVCPAGKIGSRLLRKELKKVPPFVETQIDQTNAEMDFTSPPVWPRVYISCATGGNHSIGVALAVLCLYYSDSLRRLAFPRDHPDAKGLDKDIIKQRTSMIMQCAPNANPSRTTLQSVNAFLFGA